MGKAQILVVEDDRIVAKDIQNSLRNLGFDVCASVPSGEEALEGAKEQKPDLVLMDIMLKGEMNGTETAGQIHSRFNIPVVYLTAYADEEILEKAKVAEPFGYIIKPFEERELNTAIEMALYKHKMERKLKESEEWLATTLNSIGDAVIATDTKSCVTFMNPVAESLTGWQQEEANGKPLQDVFNIINEETREGVENPVEKVLRKGMVVGLANHTLLIARDGTEIFIDNSGAPIRDEKEEITGVVLVFRDITERREAERALRESEEKLARSRKMEAMGLLAGGVAHAEQHPFRDCKLPRTAFAGFTRRQPPQKSHKDNPGIRDAGRRCCGRLVDYSERRCYRQRSTEP
ncbi:MAG: response regulator [Deltaproteobacteria bacterium]|jgi:PAS domain S-box-containing protein|nr:response regulator [Deltaproteobacteria bacterium]